ncbi:S1 domain-containing RNA-binding protein [Lactobacillaceae bacterium 24-114]
MSVEVGAKVSGKVSGITNFGAFVDLDDNQTGLVHISQVSNNYVKDIHDVLSVGDTVNVKVTKIDDNGKIALSIKAAEEKPHGERHNDFKHHHEGHNNERHAYRERPERRNTNQHRSHHENFDEMLAGYLKESESRLSTLKRQTDGKRGGRGGRRS